MKDHSRNARALQHDQIDFVCSKTFLAHYHREGLSPYSMRLQQRPSTPGRSGKPIGRPVTSEPASEELARLWQENAELRSKAHALGKQKNQLEIELRIVQHRWDASQKGQTAFRGIPDIYASSTD